MAFGVATKLSEADFFVVFATGFSIVSVSLECIAKDYGARWVLQVKRAHVNGRDPVLKARARGARPAAPHRIPICSFGISSMSMSRKMIDGGRSCATPNRQISSSSFSPCDQARKRSGFVPQARWIRAPEKYE